MAWGFVGYVCCFVLYWFGLRFKYFVFIVAYFMRWLGLPLKYCLWVCSASFVSSVAS